MSELQDQILFLGYDVEQLCGIKYHSILEGPDTQPADSCDKGCLRKCKSCKEGCSTGPTA